MDRTKKHSLTDILVVALCAVIAGADSWEEVEAFGKAKADWLKSFLTLPNGIPSHGTFYRVFARLDPDRFGEYVAGWMAAACEAVGLRHVAIDGKADRLVARHPRCRDRGQSRFDPVHYLALPERKPGGFDFAKPPDRWQLPECFGVRQRPAAAPNGWGTRGFIQVLGLPEGHSLARLTGAVPTVASECEKVAARCASGNVDHLSYPLQVCEPERIERERKAAERRLKAARFPGPKTLAEFDFAARPSVNEPLVLDLARGDYLARRENVLLVGPSGTGKTNPATALAMAACGQGERVRFWRVTELTTTLREADQERHLLRMRRQLAKLDLLVLDEFGYVPASKAGAELLFDVIGTAYERSSVILTNLAFENWTEVLGNERLAGAALDRLTHRCHIVELTGESYRLQDAKRRRRTVL